jgi:hypothetical protein
MITRRRQNKISQSTMDRRMREVFADGFGLLPGVPTELQINQMRTALQRLAEDDRYWKGMMQLSSLKLQIHTVVEILKQSHVEPANSTHRLKVVEAKTKGRKP